MRDAPAAIAPPLGLYSYASSYSPIMEFPCYGASSAAAARKEVEVESAAKAILCWLTRRGP